MSSFPTQIMKIPIFLALLLFVTPQADAFWEFATKSAYK
jgi:hypothetical protein